MKCNICKDELWVCENHQDKAWENGDGCCGGAGMLCECEQNRILVKDAIEIIQGWQEALSGKVEMKVYDQSFKDKFLEIIDKSYNFVIANQEPTQ